MKRSKKIAVVSGSIVLLFIAFATWYKVEYSMNIAKSFDVNPPRTNKNLLIATQGSDFKDALVNEIIDEYEGDQIFMRVIDVSSLSSVDPVNYNAILIIHTWEYNEPPPSVQLYINRTKKYRHKTVVYTTSGGGSYSMNNVDAISGESKIEDISIYIEKIIERLEPLLKKQS